LSLTKNFKKENKMKEIWYQFIVDNKWIWRNGFTLRRLAKVKDAVFADKDIMNDLLLRHGASERTPDQMKKDYPETFNHCWQNLASNIHYKMMDEGILKRH
jgi:hypothetical protein